MTAYVESREGNLYVGQSRVTLQTLIEAWQPGARLNSFKIASRRRHTCMTADILRHFLFQVPQYIL